MHHVLEKGNCMKAQLILLVFASYSYSAFATPDAAPAPSDRIEVIGAIPDSINAIVVEVWRTTTDSIFCQHLVGEAGFVADSFLKRPNPISISNGKRSWFIWRDEFSPGRCGWELQEIEVYMDSKASGQTPERVENISTRIAVLNRTVDSPNSWSINDDSEKPTYHHCNFGLLRNLPKGVSRNPCIFFDEKARGTDFGKYEHILRPNQHLVQFVITELENKNP